MLGTDATAVTRSSGLGEGAAGLSFELGASEGPLKFFDKTANIYVTCGDNTSNRVDPRMVTLESVSGVIARGIYDTEAARFSGFSKLIDVDVLASTEDVYAGIALRISKGRAAFWGLSIEYPLREAPASTLIDNLSADEIAASEKSRKALLENTLSYLGLRVPSEDEKRQTIARPLPQFLTSAPSKPTIVFQILGAISEPPVSGDQLTSFKDANDDFRFHALEESADLLTSTREAAREPSDPATWQPKHVVVCRRGALPPKAATPLFDIPLFYAEMAAAREKAGAARPGIDGAAWSIGDALMYGEAVTSTQTMLEK